MRITNDSHIVKFQNQVQSICKPLFNATDLSYFHFAQIYDDGRILVLNTNAAWNQHFLNQEFYKLYQPRLTPGYFLSSAVEAYQKEQAQARNFFNIDNKFEIIKRYPDHYQVAGFATPPNHNATINFYFNYLHTLEKFIFYFKDQAQRLLQTAQEESQELVIPSSQPVPCPFELNGGHANLNIHMDQLILDEFGCTLSKREIQCLTGLLYRLSAKEIASKLMISPKTAEYYIARVKNKLNIQTSSEILYKIQKLSPGLLHTLQAL